MKKLKGKTAVKVLAIFLLVLMVLMFVASFAGIFVLEDFGAYSRSYSYARENMLYNIGSNKLYWVTANMYHGVEPAYMDMGDSFGINVYNAAGTLVYDNVGTAKTIWQGRTAIWENGYGSASESDLSLPIGTEYLIVGYIFEGLSGSDEISLQVNLFEWCYSMRYALIAFAVIAFIIGVVLFIFLMGAAGHRADTDEIVPNFIDKVPFDLFTFIMALAIGAVLSITSTGWYYGNMLFEILALCVSLLIAGLLALLFFMSFSTRVKLGGLIKGCIVYRICAWLWRLFKAMCAWALDLLKALPLLKKAGLYMGAFLLAEFFFLLVGVNNQGMYVFFWVVTRLVLVPLCVFALVSLRKLRAGAAEIANGNDSYVIDTKHMRGEILAHAQDLNNISAGLEKAVEGRMKSERFKTELITNVSHDIKTPLTSIINYVDLLEKEEPENEKSQEYIAVLARQSARLKKLIDDLMDASKASTGNVAVNLERCVLGVLMDQTAGEYGEKLSDAGLELVLTKPEEEVAVMADSRHIWRVFDNLMNNACKYSMPGTRVYLSLEKKEGRALVQFRNISKSQLNISGDELMERFVRGDSSRNTDGSGLGLSIARSLAQLQNCDMDLTVDGDLFKVTLSFKAL